MQHLSMNTGAHSSGTRIKKYLIKRTVYEKKILEERIARQKESLEELSQRAYDLEQERDSNIKISEPRSANLMNWQKGWDKGWGKYGKT